MLNIKLCIPTHTMHDEGTLEKVLTELHVYNIQKNRSCNFIFDNCFQTGPYVDVNRDLLVCNHNNDLYPEIPQDIDIWLFIDNDMSPTIYQVMSLLRNVENPDIDICGVLYQKNCEQPMWNCSDQKASALKVVDFVGTGMIAFTRKYFEIVPRTWFPRSIFHYEENGNKKVMTLAEDFCMCQKAKHYNIPIWVDGSIKIKHNLRNKSWETLVQ